ncbi:MAG: GNAT family N-acetyltransferase [Sphingobacteriia bacterium]|nr:GNAT family N-acetyltransferase [Sphingobacteriia bacterium]
MHDFEIKEEKLTEDLKNKIFSGFNEYANEIKGYHGIEDPFTFVIYDKEKFIGIVAYEIVWGALHIKYLHVEKEYRKQGIGTLLMHKVLQFGKDNKLPFIYVETLNFQAPEFYKKLGFEIEFSRAGFSHNVVFHYLRKYL